LIHFDVTPFNLLFYIFCLYKICNYKGCVLKSAISIVYNVDKVSLYKNRIEILISILFKFEMYLRIDILILYTS